jgi:hypothetical protein
MYNVTIVSLWVYYECRDTLKKELQKNVETCDTVGLYRVLCMSRHPEEGNVKESRNMLNVWFTLRIFQISYSYT